MIDELSMFWRFATGLRGFLNAPMSARQCEDLVTSSIARREDSFLALLSGAVFARPQSPYGRLFRWAGAEYGDVAKMVRSDGVEAALSSLFAAGVHLKLDEFKGRRPIERTGLSLVVRPEEFDNPLLARDFEVATSGSTGARRRLAIDFNLLEFEAAYRWALFETHGVTERSKALWFAVPPGSAGLKNALHNAKLGRPAEKWFTPTRVTWSRESWKSAMFTWWAVHASRLASHSIPSPQHVPLTEPETIVKWLAEKVRQGAPAMISLPSSNAARLSQAARDLRLDISGTVVRTGGEPFTQALARYLKEVGVTAFGVWAMAETGPVGGGCGRPAEVDELHLFPGKMAVLQRPVVTTGDAEVEAFHLTTLLPSTPKVMINVDSGDTGVMSRRECGCYLAKLGMPDHVHFLRSYEKLTTGGMHVTGEAIMRLVEDVLPRRHGGSPADYQFVDDRRGTISKVLLLVSPKVPETDNDALIQTVLRHIGSSSKGGQTMAEHWRQGENLKVVRRFPFSTTTGKTPPLKLLSPQDIIPDGEE